MSNPDDEELRTCESCGRELFGDPEQTLCSDCEDGEGEFCSGQLPPGAITWPAGITIEEFC